MGVWVRLHYVYPYPHVDELIPLMAEGKILPYLDIPFQHANSRILKAMKRPAATEKTLERIRAWRKICPDITIRSTFIAGFPGETEAEFEELLAFLEEAKLDRVGCFAYSPVEGAAANQLPGHVPAEVQQDRVARLMQAQARISQVKLAARVGAVEEVLIDTVSNGAAVGRTKRDAPEVDGQVYIEGKHRFAPGEVARVKIIRALQHDFVGEFV
jgi:ribosomal protein S12 methylthiotransferase